jgi:hypothetical protein
MSTSTNIVAQNGESGCRHYRTKIVRSNISAWNVCILTDQLANKPSARTFQTKIYSGSKEIPVPTFSPVKDMKERKGKRTGKERKGKERKGKERKGKERKGKDRKNPSPPTITMPPTSTSFLSSYLPTYLHFLPFCTSFHPFFTSFLFSLPSFLPS